MECLPGSIDLQLQAEKSGAFLIENGRGLRVVVVDGSVPIPAVGTERLLAVVLFLARGITLPDQASVVGAEDPCLLKQSGQRSCPSKGIRMVSMGTWPQDLTILTWEFVKGTGITEYKFSVGLLKVKGYCSIFSIM